MRSLVFLVAAALVSFSTPAIASAASPLCPPEVKEAVDLLTAKTAIAAKMITPSKSQAGARGTLAIQDPGVLLDFLQRPLDTERRSVRAM